MPRKKVKMTAPEEGDEVTMRDWSDTWVKVRVVSIGESAAYGPTVEGSLVEDGVAHKRVALPLSHMIQTAAARNPRRGKWEVSLPDGREIVVASKKAAQDLCDQVGVVLQEV